MIVLYESFIQQLISTNCSCTQCMICVAHYKLTPDPCHYGAELRAVGIKGCTELARGPKCLRHKGARAKLPHTFSKCNKSENETIEPGSARKTSAYRNSI